MINPEHDAFCLASTQEGSICICGIIAAVRNDERHKIKAQEKSAPITISTTGNFIIK